MKYYVGVDVSKECLDVDYCGEERAYGNDSRKIEELISDLQVLKKNNQLALVICEASGGYEQKLVRACHESQIPVHVAHANKVKYFAKSQGILAKTDQIDARVLSNYGLLLKPKADVLLLSENAEKIRELLKRREQLQEDRKRENNRLDKINSPGILDSIKEHIEWLDKQIKEIDKKLTSLKKTDEIIAAHRLLTTIPAIGNLTAYYLISYLPEMGKLSHKALAALVGVAPYNHDSGNGKGKRFIQGGRSRLRQIMYMSAISAIRCNADLKAFYLRLRGIGKSVKVAIIAVIRKLITVVNSVMQRQMPWQEKYEIS